MSEITEMNKLHKRYPSVSEISTTAGSSDEETTPKEQVRAWKQVTGKEKSSMDTSKLWRIHDKYYDLTRLMNHHPGGPLVLEQSRGIMDATPLFESYHCLLDTKKIDKMMKQYEVDAGKAFDHGKTGITWEPDGFYRTAVERVRLHFHGKEYKKSNIKAGWQLIAKVAVEILIWGCLYHYAFISASDSPLAMRVGAAFFAAVIFIMLGFQLMHDASHYALVSDHKLNIQLMNLWLCIALWPGRLWHKHHVVHHHSFTGMPAHDPDVHHSMPFFRKNESLSARKTMFGGKIPDSLVPFVSSLTFFVFPGSWLGQVIVYHFVWVKRGYVWKTSLPELSKAWSTEWTLEAICALALIGTQLYGCSPLASFAYVVGLNTTYAACIFPDHDTHETYENEAQREEKEGKEVEDWGTRQATSSANWGGPIFCTLFGGINYQIEHHLFPSVHHAYLPEIAPIVRKTCKEFDVPYVHHSSIITALGSFYQKMTVLNGCGAL
jgi:fatty acid desaturase